MIIHVPVLTEGKRRIKTRHLFVSTRVFGIAILTSAALFLSVSSANSHAPEKTVEVPDLIGLTEQQAKQRLRLKNLRAQIAFSKECADPHYAEMFFRVIKQDPPRGDQVSAGSSVNLLLYPLATCLESPGEGSPSPSSPRSEFLTLDNLLSRLPSGRIAFNVERSMELGQSYDTKLVLSASQTLDALKKTLPGKVDGAEIRISPRMEARLTGQEFAITAITPEVQAVSSQETTQWAWELRPLSGGLHQLHLTVNVILLVNAIETSRSISTFDEQIAVEISVGHRVMNFFSSNWQWLWTTLFVPLAIWLWKKRTQHDLEKTGVHATAAKTRKPSGRHT